MLAVVEAIPDDTEPHPAIVAEAAAIQEELEAWLAVPLGELTGELDVSWDGTMIIREAIEDHLRRHPVIEPPAPRLHDRL